ncbi:MAG: hypothetical protein K6B71_02340 [Alphaproteobacteria bacterium]|nr:hypothetical protein [Alphaproteobacteria bacterium]
MFGVKAVVFGLCAIFATTDFAVAYVSPRVKALLREKREEYAALEQCAAKVDGFKIAGISTLGLTAAGVAGNVALAKRNKAAEECADGDCDLLKNSSNNDLSNLNYDSYNNIGSSCSDVFVFEKGEMKSGKGSKAYSSLYSTRGSNYFCSSDPMNEVKQADSSVASLIRNQFSLKYNVQFDYVYASDNADCKCKGFTTYHMGVTTVGTAINSVGLITSQTQTVSNSPQNTVNTIPLMNGIGAGVGISNTTPQIKYNPTSTPGFGAGSNSLNNLSLH